MANFNTSTAGQEMGSLSDTAVDVTGIREHMPVIASCGQRIGTVDRVEGLSIKLTKSGPAAHGEHRYIPLEWVESVRENIHLNRNREEAEREWLEAPISAGA
jgi:hypothetical protein